MMILSKDRAIYLSKKIDINILIIGNNGYIGRVLYKEMRKKFIIQNFLDLITIILKFKIFLRTLCKN